jgi:hypothetical protein
MVTTKVNGLEIAVGAESGVVYRRTGDRKMPRDLLTWQDFDDLRIWIHSRQTEQGFKPVSLEVQTLGKERHPNGVDANEAKARAALAAITSADLIHSRINHGQMRHLPIGHILQTNSHLISSESNRTFGKKEQKLRLVDDEKEQYRTFDIAITQGGKKVASLTSQMRASKADSILIAFLYAQFSAAGNKKAASDTAKMLEIESKFVYTAVRNARKNGWLTTSGIGTTSGELTVTGKKEFEKSGRSQYEEFLKVWMMEHK